MYKKEKLVRDNIPAIIRQKGRVPVIHIADDREYEQALLTKLQEEVSEFCSTPSIEELADIEEVIDAIIRFKGYTRSTLSTTQSEKRTQNGAFEKRIILESTSE